MSVRKVLFIRHGQTAYNRERRLQGALPVPLDDLGRSQSLMLARSLRHSGVDAIFSSPRPRALETAQIVGAVLKQDIREDARLGEIAFGDFEGHTFAEVKSLFPDAHSKWESGYREYRVPNGESRYDVQLRMRAAWDCIVSQPDVQTVAIVGHSSAIWILLASMFAYLPEKQMKNTSITTLERFQEIWRIRAFAETPHLPD